MCTHMREWKEKTAKGKKRKFSPASLARIDNREFSSFLRSTKHSLGNHRPAISPRWQVETKTFSAKSAGTMMPQPIHEYRNTEVETKRTRKRKKQTKRRIKKKKKILAKRSKTRLHTTCISWLGNYDSKHTLLRSTLPNHWCTRPFAQCTITKSRMKTTTKKAGNLCEYHVQSLRCCLHARKKIPRQHVDVSVSSTAMSFKMSEGKTSIKRSVFGVLTSYLAWLSKTAPLSKGEKTIQQTN